MAETQNDPLLPGYSFNAHLVTGLTPIEADGYLDFFIDRPLGMKGYILNLTIRGEGVINNHGEQFICRPGDMLLFPPGEFTIMAAIPMPASGITSGSISGRAPTGMNGLTGQRFLPRPAFSARMSSGRRALANCSGRLWRPGRAPGVTPSCWRSILWSSCCSGAWKLSTNRCIRRWITGCAMPASTSAIIWRTAISILPASPSTCACRRRACRICSASSWGSAYWGGGRISALARLSCC